MPDLPKKAGVGFKPDHFAAIRSDAPTMGFFEVHAENYMGAGGLPHAQLTALRVDRRAGADEYRPSGAAAGLV